MKKLKIGFATVLFFATLMIFANGFAFAYEGMVSGDREALVSSDRETLAGDTQVIGSLYKGGFMNEVLTRRNSTPWHAVRHYVGNKPALIVKILKEQNISLDSSVKYPIGMAVKIPQKYVLKELLPTPSQAEITIKDAEHHAQLQRQDEFFAVLLKSKDLFLAASYGFIVLLFIALFAAVMAARSWHTKFVAAASTATAKEKELEKNKDFHRQYVASAKNKEADLANQAAVLQKKYDELLAQVNQYKIVDNNGKEHPCGIIFGCPYCLPDDYVQLKDKKSMLRHISKSHPEQMNPDPKGRGGHVQF